MLRAGRTQHRCGLGHSIFRSISPAKSRRAPTGYRIAVGTQREAPSIARFGDKREDLLQSNSCATSFPRTWDLECSASTPSVHGGGGIRCPMQPLPPHADEEVRRAVGPQVVPWAMPWPGLSNMPPCSRCNISLVPFEGTAFWTRTPTRSVQACTKTGRADSVSNQF